MKPLIILLIICAVAVGVSLALVDHQGMVQVFWPPETQLTLSLNVAVLCILGLFVLLYLILRFISFVFGLPDKVKEYRLEKRQNRAQYFLNNAIASMLDGRYAQAVKMTSRALELGDSSGLAYLIGGRSAYHVGCADKQKEWFDEAIKQPWLKNAAYVSKAGLFIDAREPAEAQKAIEEISLKDRSALAERLLVKSLFMQENWSGLLRELRQSDKNSTKTQTVVLKNLALRHILEDALLNPEKLTKYWRYTSDSERQNPEIVGEFAKAAIRVEDFTFARNLLENYLNKDWNSDLARIYGSFLDGNNSSQLECAENWLKAHPKDAGLLFSIGELCERKELWGQAKNYYEASLAIEPANETRLALAELLDRLHETDAANEQYREIATSLKN